jgi:hypothetical protein
MNMSALSMPVSKQQLFCASERPSGPLVQRALNPVALAHNNFCPVLGFYDRQDFKQDLKRVDRAA